jgi:predicted NBD/HSP70 family sugar kinase
MTRKSLAGSNTSAMKMHNVRAVLYHLLRDGDASRARLAEQTALSNTAVGNLVAELLEQGILSEEGSFDPVRRSRNGADGHGDPNGHRVVGRPRTGLRLIPNARYAAGVQIGIGLLRVAVTNLHGDIVHNKIAHFDVAAPAERVLKQIASLVEKTVAESGVHRNRLLGLGVGAPGLVDPDSGVNVLAPNLGWRDVPVRDWMRERVGLPVVADNNVRAMALGESMFGAGRGADTMAFVYGRIGVGAGFVVNGKLFRGGGAGAGEIGHTVLCAENGRYQELEEIVSERVLLREAERLAQRRPKSILAQHLRNAEDKRAVERIFAAARAGDDAIREVIERQARYLGLALANLVNVLNPEMILLGGIFVDGSDLFLPVAEATMHERAFAGLGERVRLQASQFGWRAGVIGASALALAEFFYQIE